MYVIGFRDCPLYMLNTFNCSLYKYKYVHYKWQMHCLLVVHCKWNPTIWSVQKVTWQVYKINKMLVLSNKNIYVSIRDRITTCALLCVHSFCFWLAGLCNALMGCPPMVIIYEYFDKYKSLASGLSLCGQSISSFVMVALYRYSIDTFGWRGAMLIMAGMALNGCVCGMIFATNVKRKESESKVCKVLQCSVLKNCNYILFVLAGSLHICQLYVVYLLSTSRAVSKGLSAMEGSMLIPCIGIASTISRVFISWISNMKCTSHIALYTAAVFSLAALIAVSCIQPENLIYNGTVLALCGIMIGKTTKWPVSYFHSHCFRA